jgi:hypothetical protein
MLPIGPVSGRSRVLRSWCLGILAALPQFLWRVIAAREIGATATVGIATSDDALSHIVSGIGECPITDGRIKTPAQIA